ncbi:MAG: hypothetical protein RQ761_05975 [Bacteroidales bacterium]|nr:hypothetical protein [Bacteroidales bacterium]
MKKKITLIVALLLFQIIAFTDAVAQELIKPAEYFGFEPGSDRMLFNYGTLIDYLKELEKASDRIRMEQIGSSPMGKPMYIAFISSPENIARLDELKAINRDFVALTQEDTKAIARVCSTEWFPHVAVEKHQMGSTGVRYFVPPPHDPIAENIDAGIWNWVGIFGSNMIKGENDKEEFSLPIRDISASANELYCPGSWLAVNVKQNHPLSWGMPAKSGVFSRGKPFFLTSVPQFDTDRRVIVSYAKDDVLLGGYIEKVKKLEGRTVMAWLRKGKGQFVLFGFNPQFMASTGATYKLLFNYLLLPAITE